MTPVPSLSPRLFLAGGLFFGWAGVNTCCSSVVVAWRTSPWRRTGSPPSCFLALVRVSPCACERRVGTVRPGPSLQRPRGPGTWSTRR